MKFVSHVRTSLHELCEVKQNCCFLPSTGYVWSTTQCTRKRRGLVWCFNFTLYKLLADMRVRLRPFCCITRTKVELSSWKLLVKHVWILAMFEKSRSTMNFGTHNIANVLEIVKSSYSLYQTSQPRRLLSKCLKTFHSLAVYMCCDSRSLSKLRNVNKLFHFLDIEHAGERRAVSFNLTRRRVASL